MSVQTRNFFGSRKSDGTTNRSGLRGLALVAMFALLSQSGCSLNCGNLWPFSWVPCECQPGANSGNMGNSTESAPVDGGSLPAPAGESEILEAPGDSPDYGYDDGYSVGREYALRFAVDEELGSQDSLPQKLQGTGFGEDFESGIRAGMNQGVRERRATIAARNMTNGQYTNPNATSGSNGSLQAPQNDLKSPQAFASSEPRGNRTSKQSLGRIDRSSFCENKSLVKNVAFTNVVRNNRIVPRVTEEDRANELFQNSRPVTAQQTQAQQSQAQEDVPNQLSDSSRNEVSENEVPVLNANTPPASNGGPEAVQGAPPITIPEISPDNSQFKQVQPKTTAPRKIILSARPVAFPNEQQVRTSPAQFPVNSDARQTTGPGSSAPIKLTATPTHGSHVYSPSSTRTQQIRNGESVLVDHLDGVGIELDPVPMLRAQPRASSIVPATRNQQVPAQQLLTPALAPEVEGQQLPATGPDLEKLMTSPFDSMPAPKASELEPRQAGSDLEDLR